MSNGCAQVQALDRQTEAIDRQTEALERQGERMEAQTAKIDAVLVAIGDAVEAFKPAANEIADLGRAQKKLCGFIVKNRLKITAGIIGALTAIGAISPNAADALKVILAGVGAS